jgi:hypothetical protein
VPPQLAFFLSPKRSLGERWRGEAVTERGRCRIRRSGWSASKTRKGVKATASSATISVFTPARAVLLAGFGYDLYIVVKRRQKPHQAPDGNIRGNGA